MTNIHVHSSVIGAVIWETIVFSNLKCGGSYSQYTKTKPTENEAATRTERHKLGTHPNLPPARCDCHPLEAWTRLPLQSALSDVPLEVVFLVWRLTDFLTSHST